MHSELIDWSLGPPFGLLGLNTELSAAIIAAVTALVTTLVAGPIRLLVDKRLQRSQVEIEYEHEQRKALRTKIGAYHGRLLEAALDLNYRLVNLNLNWEAGWLKVDGDYRAPAKAQHYLRTTACRFVRLEGLANKFEREAIFIDARIADGTDEAFVQYAKAFRWVMTAVELFKGLDYDVSRSSAHFFNDHLRQMCAAAWESKDELEFADFEQLIIDDDELDDLLEFFDGIKPGQLRWDRLMALRLLLMAFVNSFGYQYQKSDDSWFDRVANQISHVEVAEACQAWLPKLGLENDRGAQQLRGALGRRVTDHGVA
jgi:hypothetical protein